MAAKYPVFGAGSFLPKWHCDPRESSASCSYFQYPDFTVLAMVAVGLWGAQLRAPAIWVLPVAFPMVMAFGGMLGLMGVPLPGTEYGIALSAIRP